VYFLFLLFFGVEKRAGTDAATALGRYDTTPDYAALRKALVSKIKGKELKLSPPADVCFPADVAPAASGPAAPSARKSPKAVARKSKPAASSRRSRPAASAMAVDEVITIDDDDDVPTMRQRIKAKPPKSRSTLQPLVNNGANTPRRSSRRKAAQVDHTISLSPREIRSADRKRKRDVSEDELFDK
jgi:hypothetical protein